MTTRQGSSAALRGRVQIFLDEWKERGYAQDWEQFRNWSAEQVLWDYGLSKEEIEDVTRVDGARDKGIDGWYLDDTENPAKLILIQSKDKTIAREDFSKMRDGFLDLVLPNRPKGANRALQEKAALLGFPKPLEVLLYVTSSSIAQQTLAPSPTGDLLFESSENYDGFPVHIVNYVRDIRYLAEHLQVLDSQPINVNFTVPKDEAFVFSVGGHTRTATTALPATALAKLFGEHKQNLFRRNPRYYLSGVALNAEIKKALLANQNEDFFIYNNGLTCVAKSIKILPHPDPLQEIISLQDFQIVNGCQTTASIWSASVARANLSKVRVLAKIVENPRVGSDADQVSDYIAERSNHQTPLRPQDWKANDHRQQVWRDEFSRLRPAWFYEIKRGTWGVEILEPERASYKDVATGKYRKLTLKDLGQECWAFLGSPAAAKDLARQIFNDAQIYEKVFDPSVRAVQLLLPHVIFEEAERLSQVEPTLSIRIGARDIPIDTLHLRFPVVYAVSALLADLKKSQIGYRSATESQALLESRAKWLPDLSKKAFDALGRALAASVDSTSQGPRSIVRKDEWMQGAIHQLCEVVQVQVQTELKYGPQADSLATTLSLS